MIGLYLKKEECIENECDILSSRKCAEPYESGKGQVLRKKKLY